LTQVAVLATCVGHALALVQEMGVAMWMSPAPSGKP